MPLPIVTVERLSKSYLVGKERAKKENYVALRDVITNSALNFFKRALTKLGKRNFDSAAVEEFQALKEVSFEIHEGEVVGIIGRNGAGKSTLLKILSRITEPTRGRVILRGRVASLLEVGTGFHPELTGRENIALNGAILGMSRAEIRRKFDEIVEFAEVTKFLDTPVKRYSSGMYVRLAFSIAAHLDPEILIVDEVLAVGDASFQKKCIGKMQAVSASGRTVLFVSHHMAAIRRLCNSAILLQDGKLLSQGRVDDIADLYLSGDSYTQPTRIWVGEDHPKSDEVRLIAVSVIDIEGKTSCKLDVSFPVGIQIDFEVLNNLSNVVPSFSVQTADGTLAFIAQDISRHPSRNSPYKKGFYRTCAWIPGDFLNEGSYTINISFCVLEPFAILINEVEVIAFEIIDAMDGDSSRGEFVGPLPGTVRPKLEWITSTL